MSKEKRLHWLFAVLSLLLLFLVADYFYHQDRIYAGIFVDGLDVGGKRTEEAAELLREKFRQERLADREISLIFQGNKWSGSFFELGIAPDIESTIAEAHAVGREEYHFFSCLQRFYLRNRTINLKPNFIVDSALFRQALAVAAKVIWQEPQDAIFALADDRKRVEIIPDKNGRELDFATTLAVLEQGLENYSEKKRLYLAEKPVTATITAAYLESLNVREPIATFSTTFAADDINRNHNIQLAAKAIDKTLVFSGDQFSFNKVVGKATAQRGYREAPVIVGGELVEGIGGGICQVSSTLYNTILLADLSIVERRNHGLAVSYLPPGRDATISYGWIDLKFLNDRNHAVWLRTFIDGNKLTVTFYGKVIPGHEVTILTTDLTSITAAEEIIMTADLPKGVRERLKKGQPGYHVTVWRVTKMNGEVISREMLSQDSYRSVPSKYRVGTAE